MWPEKNGKVSDYIKIPIKYSSESLLICCMNSLYHIHQYVHDFKLIYFMIFCIFRCFYHCFYLLRFLIKSCLLSSSNKNHLKFGTWFIVSYSSIYVGVYKLIYFIIFFVLGCFYLCIYLKKCDRGNVLRFLIKSCLLRSSHQNLFKFDAWIHCIIPINMTVVTC